MAVKARLKFRGDMPWNLEHKLVTRYGFRIKSRDGYGFLEVEKLLSPKQMVAEELIDGQLPEHVQMDLIRRCNAVCNYFPDPECHVRVIRIRLNNISLTLPPHQRKFVHEWMDRNVIEDQ